MSTAVMEENTMERMPKARAAMWWVVASEIVIFGGAITCYLLFRFRHPEWAAHAKHTSNMMGIINTVILLSSSFTVVLAHVFANKGEFKKAAAFLGITILCGLGFLCVKTIEYTTEIQHGYIITTNLFWSFYYFLTGLHALHVIGGMAAMALIIPGVLSGKHPQRAELVGLYWHLVDLIWIFLFPLLYLSN